MFDRRQHERYDVDASGVLLTLRDVEIESASARHVTVLATTPSAIGADASMRLTGPRGREMVLRVRTTACELMSSQPRRFRVTYSVIGYGAC